MYKTYFSDNSDNLVKMLADDTMEKFEIVDDKSEDELLNEDNKLTNLLEELIF